MNAWDVIKEKLQARLSTESYQNWISKTAFSRLENQILAVAVPNQQTRDWLESEYAHLITPILRELNLAGITYEVIGLSSSFVPPPFRAVDGLIRQFGPNEVKQ